MATAPIFTFGNSPTFDIDKKLSASGRISLSDIVAATIGTLDPEESSSSLDLLNDAGDIRYDVDDTSSASTESLAIREKSKAGFQRESSHVSFNSFIVQSCPRDASADADLEDASRFNDADDLLDHLSPRKETGMIPITLKCTPPIDSTSSNPIIDNRNNTSYNELPYLLSETALLNNPNPLFKDLQASLLDECMKYFLPKTLIDMCTPDSAMDVYAIAPTTERKFGHLDMSYFQTTNQHSEFSRCQFEMNDMEPVRLFQESDNSCSNHGSVKYRFDLDLDTRTNNDEQSSNVLDETANIRASRRYAPYMHRQRPMLSRRAVRMMEDWYSNNYKHPYPDSSAVEVIATTGGITNEQVKKWFANKRNRCKNTQ